MRKGVRRVQHGPLDVDHRQKVQPLIRAEPVGGRRRDLPAVPFRPSDPHWHTVEVVQRGEEQAEMSRLESASVLLGEVTDDLVRFFHDVAIPVNTAERQVLGAATGNGHSASTWIAPTLR